MTLAITACGIASTVLAIYCNLPYWRSIISGRTQPHQFSWLIFMIMNAIVTISQFLEGGRVSVLISLTFFVGSFVNFLLSLKFGSRDTSRFDRLLFGMSIFTIVVWVLTKNNAAAIWLTVAIDVFATSMIVLKIKANPSSEAPGPWIIATVAFTFAIVTLIDTEPGILYVRPIYGWLSDVAIIAAIYYFRYAQRSSPTYASAAPAVD